jgi:hypothetical protein
MHGARVASVGYNTSRRGPDVGVLEALSARLAERLDDELAYRAVLDVMVRGDLNVKRFQTVVPLTYTALINEERRRDFTGSNKTCHTVLALITT